MKPLYKVWQALSGSQAPNGEYQCWGACWEGNVLVQLPIAEARAYARELTRVSKLPTEVRNKHHQVKATFGLEAA
jgi:hypothetical protein